MNLSSSTWPPLSPQWKLVGTPLFPAFLLIRTFIHCFRTGERFWTGHYLSFLSEVRKHNSLVVSWFKISKESQDGVKLDGTHTGPQSSCLLLDPPKKGLAPLCAISHVSTPFSVGKRPFLHTCTPGRIGNCFHWWFPFEHSHQCLVLQLFVLSKNMSGILDYLFCLFCHFYLIACYGQLGICMFFWCLQPTGL